MRQGERIMLNHSPYIPNQNHIHTHIFINDACTLHTLTHTHTLTDSHIKKNKTFYFYFFDGKQFVYKNNFILFFIFVVFLLIIIFIILKK